MRVWQIKCLFLISLVVLLENPLGAKASATSEGRGSPEIFAPAVTDQPQSLPLIVLLHGYAGNADLIDFYFGLSREVLNRKFVLVIPNGKVDSNDRRFWNATPACCDFDHTSTDDVRYLLDVIKNVQKNHRIDSQRIYVVGHSNGAFMAQRLACEPQSPIQGIVSFAGAAFLNSTDCHATHPVSFLQIHAVDDDTIRFDGDPVGYPKLAPYPSVDQTMKQWVCINRCQSKNVGGDARKLKLFAGATDTDTFQWRSCERETELWRIRASNLFFRTPHTPLLTDQFAESVLGFLGI